MREIENLRPMMKIDYVGFTYGDYHSSQFGLVRVSSGNRYSEYLSPTLKNTTTDVNGMNGSLFFGTNKTTRSFSVNMAFDKVKEADIRDIKEWLSGEPKPLIFDERPYVEYMCVVNSAPQIQYIPFDEDGERVYKGELTVSFISYLSYGMSVKGKKFADDFEDENFDEWSDSSLIPYKEFYISDNGDYVKHSYDVVEVEGDDESGKQNVMWVYNAGDMETDYELKLLVFGARAKISLGDISCSFTMPALTNGNSFILSINSKMMYAYAEEVKWTDEISLDDLTPIGDKVLLIPDSIELPKLPRGRSKFVLSIGDHADLSQISYRYRYV